MMLKSPNEYVKVGGSFPDFSCFIEKEFNLCKDGFDYKKKKNDELNDLLFYHMSEYVWQL